MTKKEAIKIFEEKKVRTVWDDEQEKWYFSIIDVVANRQRQPSSILAQTKTTSYRGGKSNRDKLSRFQNESC